MTILVISFLGVFAVVLVAVSLGWSFVEAQQKKKVVGMLETVAGEKAVTETTVLKDPASEGQDLLNRLLAQLDLSAKLQAQIQQAGLDWTIGKLLLTMAIAAAVGAVLGLRLKVLIVPALSAAGLAVLLGIMPYLYVLRKRSKRMSMFEEQFPEALDFVSRAMRAGHAFSVSLEMLADESPEPLAREFRQVFNEQNLGAPIESALQNLAMRMPLLDVSFFVSAVMLQKETGGNLSEILTKLSYVIRERFKLKGQVRAASAHGRITGLILTIMPIVLMFALLVCGAGLSARHGQGSRRQVAHHRRDRRTDTGVLLYPADHQYQGVDSGIQTMAALISVILFVFLMGAITVFGYRRYARPGRLYDQLGASAAAGGELISVPGAPERSAFVKITQQIGEKVPLSPQDPVSGQPLPGGGRISVGNRRQGVLRPQGHAVPDASDRRAGCSAT